jgi:uncharacterized membrane protein
MISFKNISTFLVTLILALVVSAPFAYAQSADGPTSGTPQAGGPTSGTPQAGGPTSGTPQAGGPTSGASDSSGGLKNPLKATSLAALINDVIGYAVELGAILVTLMLIYVGFLFVAAQGNDEKLKSARSALVWTVIGGLILLGASAISAAIGATVKSLTS